MSFQFLTPENLVERYNDAKTYTLTLTKPFPEFDRIAHNLPHPSIDKRYPKTTDGTTASIIRKTPRRVIQQLPTGKVIADDEGWLGVVAGFIYTDQIIPHANQEYSLIQKGWSIVEKGLTFGSCATYTPFLSHDGDFGPDLTVPYWGDMFLQKGKKSGYDCDYIFMRSWWQKEDVENLIDKETKLGRKAKRRGDSYDSSWDVKALKTILTAVSSKDAMATTQQEKDRGINTSGIELVTGFQKGEGATFYTFNPLTETIVRTKDNKDPRGKMPIDWMYGDIDGSNPLGRGIVELVGPLQNLIDSDMQMYQFNRALMLAPPIIKHGDFSKKKIIFEPNAIIDLGSSAANSIEPLKIDTSAVASYPALYSLQKSQLLNLTNSPDTTIGTDAGNPTFGKTPQAIQTQNNTISVDDNYVRKMFEVWFQNWSETAINLYFAERSGVEKLQLDKDTAMKLREMPNFDLTKLSDDNKLMIDYDTATPALKFRVDPNTTSVKDTAAQVESAHNLLDLTMTYPQLNSNFGGPIDVDVLARRLVVNSGIDDPEQVAPEPTEAQKQSKEEQKNTVNPFSPMFDKPSIRMNYPDLPPAAQVQVLNSAGVHVTEQDILAGPVLDPNMRGVINPVDDPNILVPGGGPAVQSTPGQAPAMGQPQQPNPLQQDGVNLTPQEIQRLSQDPRFAQQQPQQAQQNQAPAMPQQQPQMPQQQQPTQPQQSPHDDAIIQQLQQLGFPPHIIQEAIDLLNKGYTAEQVMQALGAVSRGQ
jgi:hypothetical protein